MHSKIVHQSIIINIIVSLQILTHKIRSHFLEELLINKEIEIESISKFLTASLKAKIKEEALDLNLLKEKRKSKLPL